jgi:ribosome-associated toxin RatA of RatAB toxin-antitoxin module
MILESLAKKHRAASGRSFLPTVQRNARVPYSAQQMFDLVNDLEKYPEFLHWCGGARIDVRQGSMVEATLDISVLGFKRSFRTRNTLRSPERIEIELVSGPFRRLRGEWRFGDLSSGGSEVALSLAFEVTQSPFGALFSRIFEEIAGAQMQAFTARAEALYGARES